MVQKPLTAADIGSTCFCLAVRKAARAIARRYDDAFRPLGITSGQFSILAALLQDRPVPLGVVADILGMDRTTMTRNLRPLEAENLVTTVGDKADRRVRGLQLTPAGKKLIQRAIPLWQEQQSQSRGRLKGLNWQDLQTELSALA